MASLIFVHGTGVRKGGYEKTFDLVKGELRAEKPQLDVQPCLWGDEYGVKLNGGGASIPSYATARSIGSVGGDEDIALWSVLYQDPLFELRLLASNKQDGAELIPGQAPPGAALQDAIDQFQLDAELPALLSKTGYASLWNPAWTTVVQSGELYDAVQTVGASAAEHRRAIAHAVIAQMTVLARDAEISALSGEVRDEMVGWIIVGLGGQERGIGTWVADQFKGIAAGIGTSYLKRKRGAISDAAYPGVGDILWYELRGALIRDFVHKAVDQASEPVTLLAHSLGGIACVDLLIMNALPKVKRLITAGSQAPFLYEIDCLPGLRWNDRLPDHFPAWLNIYDSRDILSYLGAGVFKDRVRDVEVDNGQPFPESHSAYWTNPRVWKEIVAFLP